MLKTLDKISELTYSNCCIYRVTRRPPLRGTSPVLTLFGSASLETRRPTGDNVNVLRSKILVQNTPFFDHIVCSTSVNSGFALLLTRVADYFLETIHFFYLHFLVNKIL